MLLDRLIERQRQPADCIVRIDGDEIVDLYPFLAEVSVETRRSEAATAMLRFDTRRDELGRWSVQDAGVLEHWKEISIEAAFGSSVQTVLRGRIGQVSADYPDDPGATSVHVECLDESFALDRAHVRKVWGAEAPTSDGAMLADILRRHGLRPHRSSENGLSGLVISQDTTDARFLRQRAEANGYELLFSPDGVYFGPPRLGIEPQATIRVYAGESTHCTHFRAETDGHRPDRIAFDSVPQQGAGPITQRVLTSDLMPLGTDPATSDGAGLDDFTWRLRSHGGESPAELEARALHHARENAFKLSAEGELDGSRYGHVLRVGEPVPVDGTGEWLGGVYYVDRVSHHFSHDGYRQSFRLLRNAYGDNLGGGVLGGLSRLAAIL
ncbi:MAG: hypothetical protein AAF560_12815 [Acidobacteriota bacterium]